jgi:hypothetical protein
MVAQTSAQLRPLQGRINVDDGSGGVAALGPGYYLRRFRRRSLSSPNAILRFDLLTLASARLEHITKRPECRGVIDRGMFLPRHALVMPTDCRWHETKAAMPFCQTKVS